MKILLVTFLLIGAIHAQKPQQPPCKENASRGCLPAESAQPVNEAAKSPGRESAVVFTWSYNYAAVPLCTAKLTTNCVHHFLLSEGSNWMVAIAATTALNYTYILYPLPRPGSHNYNLVAVQIRTGINDTIASPAARASVNCRNSQQCQVQAPPPVKRTGWY